MAAGEVNPRFGTDLRDGFRTTNAWVSQGIGWLDDIQLFYRERAIIENDYAAKLSLLAKQYMEKKAAKTSVLSVGKTPTITPGSLESASMTTWAIQLTAIENQSAKHKEFATNIQIHLVDHLKALQSRYDSLRQTQVLYAKKLEDEKLAMEEDVRKHKAKYDSVCQEVENRRKKADGDSKGKASAAFQQQLGEMHDAKNAYLLSIAVANAQQERYYFEYLPETLDNLQEISESRIGALNQVWMRAANLELDTLSATAGLLHENLSEIPRNDPKLDSLMFSRHNETTWQGPPEIGFEPSSVWHDDPALVTDDRAKNFLRNCLTRSKAHRIEQKSQLSKLNGELKRVWTGVEQARNHGGDADEGEATKALFQVQEFVHESTRQLVTAETEIHTITSAVGDISVGARNHPFKPDTFKIPSQCDFCGDKIWGISAKGVICQDCGYTCHLKCQMKSPADCPGEQTKEEKKKLKQERQEYVHSMAHLTISDSASTVGLSAANVSQRSLTLPGGVGRARSESDSRPDEESHPTPPGLASTPASGSRKVTPVGRTQRRVLAPPPPMDSHQNGGFEHVKGKALYSYEAAGPDQITVHENDDVVMVEPDDNSGWIKIKCNLSTGLVPKTYISLNTSSGSAQGPPIPVRPGHRPAGSVGSVGSTATKKGPAVAPRRGARRIRYARALYSYDATGGAMHSITEGEQLVLVNLEASPGWAEVEKDSVVKYVPRDYIVEVTE